MNKAERTRQYIIEKRRRPSWIRSGYAGTSLSDMTEATGLTKGSIYGNFADKDEVALAVFDYNVGKLGARTLTGVDQQQSAREKLLAYIGSYQLRNPLTEGGCPVMNTSVEADDTHPQLKSRVRDFVLAWKDRLAALIQSGIDNKEFLAGTDPEATALTIIAMIEGAILINQATGKSDYRKLVLNSVEKLIRTL